MAEKEKKSSENNGRYKVVELALSGTALFAAIAYVLGRLYKEAYYNALGIAPGLLSLGPNDYMFSSINLIIICVMASLYLYLYYYATVRGVSMFFWLPSYSGPRSRTEKIILYTLVIIISLIFAVTILVGLYSGWLIYLPGLTGVAIGMAVGISMLLYIRFVLWLSGRKSPALPYFIIIGLLLLVAWLPSISSNLAKIEAITDTQTFPKAVIISQNALSPQLQSSPQSQNESVEVSIITTNNDMTYVLKEDVDSDERWEVYRIQNRNIETIIFAVNSS
jgi:FlaA1/EpsC-like NDP-sugar epimerase